ncbi:MAG: cytochrome c [Candidatus Acidoferrales bacterium]
MRRAALPVLAVFLLASACMSGQGTTEEPKDSWSAPAEARSRRNPVEASESSVERGRMLYRGNCYLCHGAEGHGDGPWVEQLPEKPSDLTDPEKMRGMSDGEIFWKISRGREQMPAFEKQLSEHQRWDVVNYLRWLGRAPQGRE